MALFIQYVEMPTKQIEAMRQAPTWPQLEAIAPTLAYDHTAIMGKDRSVPIQRAAHVLVPTLVMNGGASAEPGDTSCATAYPGRSRPRPG